MELVDGIINIADRIAGRDGKNIERLIEKVLTEYVTKYARQHSWNLPYVKEVDWDKMCERFKAEETVLRAL